MKTYDVTFDKDYTAQNFIFKRRINNCKVKINAQTFKEAREKVRNLYPMARNIQIVESNNLEEIENERISKDTSSRL